MLSLLLARIGVPVMLLETHKDFDRDFRGDTIHASVMEIMDELGLADRLLQIPHTKMRHLTLTAGSESVTVADFRRLKNLPYITVLPQVRFLDFITGEAQKYPNFQLLTSATWGNSSRKMGQSGACATGGAADGTKCGPS